MLFEKYAFMRHVLIDDPQSLGIYRDDEAGIYLPERLQLAQANRTGRSFHRVGCGRYGFTETRRH